MDIGDLRKDITRKYSYLADPKKKKKKKLDLQFLC